MSKKAEPQKWTPILVPPEVQQAREELAHRVLEDPSLIPLGILEAERIVTSSTWRMKLGGTFECAVCSKGCGHGRRNLCRQHDDWRFLWHHHSGSPRHHRRFTVTQVFDIACLELPDNVKEILATEDLPTYEAPLYTNTPAVYQRRWHGGFKDGFKPCSQCGLDSTCFVTDYGVDSASRECVWYCEACSESIQGRWIGE